MSEPRELSYLELALDNIIGFDNGYDSAGERFGRWFNKDEREALKTIGKGAYEGAKEFVTSPIETTKEAVSDVYNSGKDLVTKDLEARVEEMFGVPYFLATPEQINKAKEGVFGDIANVSGVVPSPAGVAKSAAKKVGQNILLSEDTPNLSRNQHDAFAEAKNLKEAGKTNREIKDATAHWSDEGIGVDYTMGSPLLEIPDDKIKTFHDNPPAPPVIDHQTNAISVQQQIQDISRRVAMGEMTDAEAMEAFQVIKTGQNALSEARKYDPPLKRWGNIDDVVEDLPASKHIDKEWTLDLDAHTDKPGLMGRTRPGLKEVEVYAHNHKDRYAEINTLLHEIQHIIDADSPSSYGKGANAEDIKQDKLLKPKFKDAYERMALEIEGDPLFKKLGFDFDDKVWRDDLLQLFNSDGSPKRDLTSQWFEGQEPVIGWEAIGRYAQMAESFRVLSVSNPGKIYTKELGEVKARLVEYSQNWNNINRQQSLLSDRYRQMEPDARGGWWAAEDFKLGGIHNPVKESTTESVIDTILKDYE